MGPLRPNRPSDHVAPYLAANEKVVLEMKQHWARVLPAMSSCTLGFVLAVAAGLMAPAWMGVLANAAWWIWLVLVGHLAWRLVEWWDETFVITNKRLILVHGLFVKKVAMMPLRKVTDMSYNRSPWARVLGYGTFVMESAGQDQALNVIDFVRDPDSKYREICGLIFGKSDGEGDKGKESKDSKKASDGDANSKETPAPTDAEEPIPQADPDEPEAGWEGSPRAWRGRRAPAEDDTDPYGMVTYHPVINQSDPDHVYGGPRDVGEYPDGTDGDSAWSVSREHATTPQIIRRSRQPDTQSAGRDTE